MQTRHQNHCRTAFQLQFGRIASHQAGQFIMHYLYHQLAGLHSRQHILSQRFLFHRIGEVLCNLIIHIGVKQGATHILQGLRHIDFGDLAFTLQYLERPFQSFA